MRITFNGAAHTVTGSQFLLELNGSQMLIDCGLYQGKRSEAYQRNLKFRFDPHALDAVILTHAHIDHSGNLPNLVKHGYRGPIYATKGTARLSDVMLRDSGHIQESDIEFVNRKRLRRGERPLPPLYTEEDAALAARQFHPLDYEAAFQPVEGVTARLADAGHILGSSSVLLDVQENGRAYRVCFSGDIGRRDLPLLRDPVLPQGVDYLVMESTYGDKNHDNPTSAYDELRQTVQRTVQRGGKVIVPAFAVGRTQEIVFDLNRMMTRGEIPAVPVFVDSPLAVNATRVFQSLPEYFDEETNEFIRTGKHPALSFPQLTYITSVDQSKALNDRHEPMIILSASGMAEAGRILHHLRNNIEDPRNTVLIVGWQAPDTLGRRLADREPHVRIFGEAFERRAEVVTIGGFSGHAGQDMLVEYARSAGGPDLQEVMLVHGEPRQAGALTERLRQAGIRKVVYPELYQTVEISPIPGYN
ncbi:MAG: MBL fold metallo-hydrolase [Chloroflexi bacterium]|nr:MBL fold metallo-hydrolase [Chloroflexota bacterium]